MATSICKCTNPCGCERPCEKGCVFGIGDLKSNWDSQVRHCIGDTVLARPEHSSVVRESLIRTVSLLHYIREPILTEYITEWIERKQFDDSLLELKEKPEWVQTEQQWTLFNEAKWRFTAPIIVEGVDIRLEQGKRWPWRESEDPNGNSDTHLTDGANQDVKRHLVLRGHLELKRKVSLPDPELCDEGLT